VSFDDPFGLCYDKETKQERPCKVEWAEEASDRKISAKTALAAQVLADKANVDLTLSSGFREFNSCSATLHACGTAVDMSAINGHDVGQGTTPNQAAMPFVQRVQETARGMGDVQENLGPAGLFRSGSPGQPQTQFTNGRLQAAHNNHVHEGFRRSLRADTWLDPIYRALLR
jgi:hypothetical protein